MAAGLVLASASPRRRELLRRLVTRFDVVASTVDETLGGPVSAAAVAAVAWRKARAVAAVAGTGLVLAADTVVVIDGEALGKPLDRAAARMMLRRLRGRPHAVITGVAVMRAPAGPGAWAAEVSTVVMRAVSDAEIARYVATDEPMDKAGAYAVQGEGARLVVAVIGSYSNVIGLPLAATRRLLAGAGLRGLTEPPAAG